MKTTKLYLGRTAVALATLVPLSGCTPEQIVGGMAIASGAKKGFYITKGQPTYHDWNAGAGNIAQVLPEADPKTFRALTHAKKAHALYAVDAHNAYIADYYTARLVPGADGATFEVLSGDGAYSRDSQQVYYYGAPLEGADPASFEPLTRPFGQDDDRAFIGPVAIPVRDISTWRPLQKGHVGDPWYRSQKDYHIDLEGIMPTGWSIDSKCAYYGENPIDFVDVESFELLSRYYARDKKHVYSQNFGKVEILRGADRDTFKVQEGIDDSRPGRKTDAHDKNHLYRYGKVAKP